MVTEADAAGGARGRGSNCIFGDRDQRHHAASRQGRSRSSEFSEMKTFQKLRDGKISVEMEVCGSGEPLLFLHGAGGLMGVDPFLEELGKDFKVIAPSLPGYGESTGGDQIDDVIDAALFYHELMDELKIPSAYIAGHSMGGMIAAEVAALDIRRAKKLVLVSSAGFWLDEHPIPELFAE